MYCPMYNQLSKKLDAIIILMSCECLNPQDINMIQSTQHATDDLQYYQLTLYRLPRQFKFMYKRYAVR